MSNVDKRCKNKDNMNYWKPVLDQKVPYLIPAAALDLEEQSIAHHTINLSTKFECSIIISS